jgi:uncharacterized lipoprotein NlpE involved in copper resistance
MPILKKQLQHILPLFLFCTLFGAYHPAMAETDLTAQENFLKARASSHPPKTDHTGHHPEDESQKFRGVFYGFLPCNDCDGIKMTLSLKQNNNYLLVTQYARESSRELYEKGKYSWDEEKHLVVLTPRKQAATHQFLIENGESLIQLNSDGTRMTGKLADRYVLRRSDTVKSREVHFH